MPRFEAVEVDQAQGRSRELLEGVQQKIGSVPNIFRQMALAPAVLDAYLSMGKAMAGASLSPAVREQLAVAIANVNGCEYCASAHTAIGGSLGLEAGELQANLTGRSGDARVQAALEFVRGIVANRAWVDGADVRRVRDAGWSDPEILEMIAVVAQNLFTNYFNHIVETEVDFPRVQVAQPVTA